MSYYCNAPIIVTLQGQTAATGHYFPCRLLALDGNEKTPMSAECGSGKSVKFDLSAYAKGKLYSKTLHPTSAVPSTQITYKAGTGSLNSGNTSLTGAEFATTWDTSSTTINVYLGRGDALARYRGSESSAVSYKPTDDDMEVYEQDDYYVARGQTAAVTEVLSAMATKPSGIYIEANARLRHQLVFLNSFGRWESASALSRESKQYNSSTETVEVDGSFIDNINREKVIVHKQLESVNWKMSSGGVTPAWAEWWAKEVLAAENVWLRNGSSWIPVVLDADTVTPFDKTKGSLPQVDFTLKFK